MNMDKADLHAMDSEELENYKLNCEVYERMARNMMNAAFYLDGQDNPWVFGCSFFPDSVFSALANYSEPADKNKESLIFCLTAEQKKAGKVIFDRTSVDMTRPFSVRCAFLRGFGNLYLTFIQYLD